MKQMMFVFVVVALMASCSTGVNSEETQSDSTVQSYSIDWTTDQYIITAVQPNALSESQRLSGMYVMKI